MKIATLTWSYVKGEGTATTTSEFAEADVVVQLDALVDCIADLQRIYNEHLAAHYGSFRSKYSPPKTD